MQKTEKFDQTAYKNKYNSEKYDRVNLTMPKGQKGIVQEKAAAAGESVNEYINRAIRERMEREN